MEKSKQLVSIIIPVFNTERYLAKCIDSIVRQSYRNLDVILVDDGSTDSSSLICDDYAKSDKRVRVVHQDNSGLSAARNAGIKVARGDYLVFVDSDDFIEHDMIAYLLDCFTEDIDIVTCGHVNFYEGEVVVPSIKSVTVDTTVNATTALEDAMYAGISTFHACFKMYRSDLFRSIKFPVGKLYEDAGTIYKVLSRATKIRLTNAPKYYYLQRKGSITRSSFDLRKFDLIQFSEDICHFVSINYPELKNAAGYYLFSNTVWLIETMSRADVREYASEYNRCYDILRSQAKIVMHNRKASLQNRIYSFTVLFGTKPLRIAISIKKLLRKLKK